MGTAGFRSQTSTRVPAWRAKQGRGKQKLNIWTLKFGIRFTHEEMIHTYLTEGKMNRLCGEGPEPLHL